MGMNVMLWRRVPAAIRWAFALLLLLLSAPLTHAATLRIASAFDPQTMDPHALALLYHSRVYTQVYESLVNRDAQYRLAHGASVGLACNDLPCSGVGHRPRGRHSITMIMASAISSCRRMAESSRPSVIACNGPAT